MTNRSAYVRLAARFGTTLVRVAPIALLAAACVADPAAESVVVPDDDAAVAPDGRRSDPTNDDDASVVTGDDASAPSPDAGSPSNDGSIGTSDAGAAHDSSVADSRTSDTGAVDTGTRDTGTVDTGTVDTGTIDTGTRDTGVVDTGTRDSTIDTGAADTGAADTGAAPDPTGLVWRKANLTWFTSYPDPGSEECLQYNGCTWAGQFAGVDGKQSESWVQSHNIAAVHSKDFSKYELKTLRLKQGTKTIDVVVYDMCADSDCSGCCTKNAGSLGYLIDLESYTAARFGADDGVVDWACLDCGSDP